MANTELEVAAIVGGEDVGSEYDQRDCELLALAFDRAAEAIKAGTPGRVVATNSNGCDVADIEIGARNKILLHIDDRAPDSCL